MKKICISIPCYNEVENIRPLYESLVNIFKEKLNNYDYCIQFIDNHSNDGTRTEIQKICSENENVRAIFNVRNFPKTSAYHGFLTANGDCTISMAADFQDPPEMIPEFVKEWENGYTLVLGVKKTSKENKIMYNCRKLYYKIMNFSTSGGYIEQCTGFGLYDKAYMDFLRGLNDPCPDTRGTFVEYGYGIKLIPYVRPVRRDGKSKNNFLSLIGQAIRAFTMNSIISMRFATFAGLIMSFVSFIVATVYFILKIIYWDKFSAGMAPILIGVFFMGSVQLFFMGLIGEYLANIDRRLKNRPHVIEEKRINF